MDLAVETAADGLQATTELAARPTQARPAAVPFWSDALGPAGGSLEYELAAARAHVRRQSELLAESQAQAGQWRRAFQDAESERLRLAAELRTLEAERAGWRMHEEG